ncbi:hypothetical protein [Streptomyces murinus]|uniref:hypothetical protein n=1 Tax=Streptomyces murinus TaxID=33900 RepID=UPI00381279EC
MSFVDVPDVFIGSTDDAHTFLVLNRPVPGANRLLTDAGFTARKVNGRTVYLLAPTTSEDANEQTGIAMYGLLAHTHDLVDLSWTTRWNPQDSGTEPDLRFTFTGTALAASATTPAARSLLELHGFAPADGGGSYRPTVALNETDVLGMVVRAEAHAHAVGIGVRVELGIPTPDAIPAPPRGPSSAVPGGPPSRPARRHTP